MSVHAGFVAGRRGRLLSVEFRPAGPPLHGVVVHLPAFAEEMNKSRRQVALQARSLAAAGWRVVVADPYGTGDSEGDFGEADWDLWLEDLAALCEGLDAEQPPLLWGLRTGVLLARALLERVAARGLICWQPVLRGDQFLNQFLRLRLAATMLGGGERETAASLREQLRETGSLEVAGYRLSQHLATALEAAALSPPPNPLPTLWYEIVGNPQRRIGPASQKLLERWREAGGDLHSEAVVGEPFWSTQEIHTAPALIGATTAALKGWETRA